jgi:hypothetical protein
MFIYRSLSVVCSLELNNVSTSFTYHGGMEDPLKNQPGINLALLTAREHAKTKQKASRQESAKRGRRGRLQHKGKARTAEKPWGGRKAR